MITEEEIKVNLKILSNVMLNFEDALCDSMQEKVKQVKQYIEQLEFQSKALKQQHDYDMKMIDDVKGEAVKLYNEIKQLETEKQNLIEKLERDIEELDVLHDNYIDANVIEGTYETLGRLSYAKRILSYMKGEEK